MVQFPMCGLRLHLSAFLIGSIGLVGLYTLRHRDLNRLLDTSLIPVYLFVAFYLAFFLITFSKSRRFIRTFLLFGQVFWWLEVWSVILSAHNSWSPYGSVQYMRPIWDEVVRQCSENSGDATKTVFGTNVADCGRLEVGLTMYMIMGEVGWRAANIFLLGALSLYYRFLSLPKESDIETGVQPQPVTVLPTEKLVIIDTPTIKVEEIVDNQVEADKEIGENVALLS